MNTAPTLTLTADGIAYSVTFDRWDALQRSRAHWHWRITDATADAATPADATLAEGADLTTVSFDGLNAADALSTLLTFLAAHLEALDYEHRTGQTGVENADLFPRELTAAAALDADDIAELAELMGGAE